MATRSQIGDGDSGFTVYGVFDQHGNVYVAVNKHGKTAYVPVQDFMFGLGVAIAKLAQQGVIIVSAAHQRRLRELADGLDEPTESIFVASQPGWLTRTAFMLADGTLIVAGRVQHGGVVRNFEPVPGFEMRGNLEFWTARFGPLVRGQHLLQGSAAFALSAALLRDFARLAGITDNPMLNIIGPSSCGKTTLVRFVGSLYGISTTATWLSTANAIEDYLQSRTDGFLALDEAHLAGADARSRANLLGTAVMVLASGRGKARKGQAPSRAGRLLVLSTSNTHLLSFAPNAAAIDPALQVRMPAIDLLGRPHGILDVVPGGDAAAIINAINRATQQVGGAPIRAFIMRLTEEMATNPEGLRLRVQACIKVFERVARRHGPLTPLEERIIGRFALADVAGILASTWGILPAEWKYDGSGVMKMFLMARDTLRTTAHSDPIARFELALGRMRAHLHEEARSTSSVAPPGSIGTVARRQNGVIELAMRKADFVARFDSVDPRLLHLLHGCGALAVEAIGRDGTVRHTVKRQLFPGHAPERVIAIRLDAAAYPAALKVRRAD